MIGVWIAINLIESPTGRALRAIHDSETAARVLGVNVARYKLTAFVLSAAYASVAGSYFAGVGLGVFTALFGGFVSPAYTTAASFAVLTAVLVLRPGGLAAGRGSR